MANLEDFRIPQYEGCGIYAIVNSQNFRKRNGIIKEAG